MTWKKGTVLSLLLLLLLLPLESSEINHPEKSTAQDHPVSIKNLTENITQITVEYSLRPNIAALTGPDGVLLIDTGHKQVAGTLLSAVKGLQSGDIKFIINTHLHGDHAGANLLVSENAETINCKNLDHYVTKGIISRGKEEPQGRDGQPLKPYYSLVFNREKIELIP